VSTAAKANTYKLRLERTIRAKRARVFEAWTMPELLQKWSAPEGMSIPEGESDVRPGGRWRVVMQEPNGTQHIASGVYRDVVPHERLVYTHAWQEEGERREEAASRETLMTVEFREEGDATRVVLIHEGFPTSAVRDGHEGGWASCLTRLERLFADRANQKV
jgi:uncharacterized protein YndB with AHSA1/START domain